MVNVIVIKFKIILDAFYSISLKLNKILKQIALPSKRKAVIQKKQNIFGKVTNLFITFQKKNFPDSKEKNKTETCGNVRINEN